MSKCAEAVTFEQVRTVTVTRFSWRATLYELPVLEDNGASSKPVDTPSLISSY